MNAENLYDAWDNGDRHEVRQQFAKREKERIQHMTDRELMQQALEALEMWCKGPHDSATRRGANTRSSVAITALRERLAQPQRTHWEGCEEVHPECREKNA